MLAMAASGACALAIGLTFGGPPVVTLVLAAVWGVTIIADSAQFSTAVTELCPPAYVGTALTTQTCAGFALTMLTHLAHPAGRRRRRLALGVRHARARPRAGRGRHGPSARAARGARPRGRPPLMPAGLLESPGIVGIR